jgi:dTDP-4-amino-4,6-dideoxygalactose transaminase
VRPGDRHSWVHWVARTPERTRLQDSLAGLGVQTKPYFAAIHLGPLGNGERLPVTEALDAEALALPVSSELTVEQAERVVVALGRCLPSLPDDPDDVVAPADPAMARAGDL